MSVLLSHFKRRVSFLVGDEEIHCCHCEGVGQRGIASLRACDAVGSGMVFAPDFTDNARLISDRGTQFSKEAEVGGYWVVLVRAKGHRARTLCYVQLSRFTSRAQEHEVE
jgi:hypothetical protein